MVTQGQRHELKQEVERLNAMMSNILEEYCYTGDNIPTSQLIPINKDIRFRELRAQRLMLLRILGMFNLRVEKGFELLPYLP